jgi:hypothetical protein
MVNSSEVGWGSSEGLPLTRLIERREKELAVFVNSVEQNMQTSSPEKWDVFISHASEDKKDFVEPLASALEAFGVGVWYADYALRLGDSLSRSIDRGLAKSDYGIVVLSPAFFAKKWPEYELRGLTAKEMVSNKVILPIWHNVSYEDVLAYSPPLADKLAIKSNALKPLEIAVEVIKAVRPEIFTAIQHRQAFILYVVKPNEKRFLYPNLFWHLFYMKSFLLR